MQQKSHGAVIVTRVSTGEQVKHGTSLESQLEACRQKALALKLPIVAEYEDAGLSGAYLSLRAGMMAAIADIEEGRADTLICANLSRFSRNAEHQQQVKNALQNAGGRLVFCDMDFEDTPEGDMMFGLVGTFAEYERKMIRARTMRGKRKRAEEGQQPQRSRSPYGYHIITNAEVNCGLYPTEQRGHYLIVEETAAVVRRIYAEYVSGLATLPKITRLLNHEGIPTPGNGRLWQHPTVRVILTNPVYKGEPVSGRQKCHVDESRLEQRHKWTGKPIKTPEVRRLVPESERLTLSAPPLVSREMWDAAQERLNKNRTSLKGNPRQVRMLSGRTVCPYCGAQGVIKQQKANGRAYPYFICGAQRKATVLTGEKPCSGDLYPVALMEEATVRVMQEAWQRPEALAAAQVVYEGNLGATPHDTVSLQKEWAGLNKALDGLKQEEMMAVRAQLSGMQAGASSDVYNEVFAEIAARRKDLEERRGFLSVALASSLGERKQASRQRISKTVEKALEDAARVLSNPNVPGAAKRDILSPLVEKVILHKDGVEVVFVPGLFDEAGDKNRLSNCYTTCIGIRTHK